SNLVTFLVIGCVVTFGLAFPSNPSPKGVAQV
ncbi:unnamed protein product, partial [Allacma fusca]